MDVAAASEDTGTLQALKALDSLESKLNQVQVAYQQFYTSIGAEDAWKSVLNGTKNFIDTLNNLPKLFGKIPVGAIVIVADVISTIKDLAFSAFAEIAGKMTDILQNGKMKQQGQEAGDNFVSGAVEAIKSRTEEIKAAIEEGFSIKEKKEAPQIIAEGIQQVNRANEYRAIDPLETIGGVILDSTTGYELELEPLLAKMAELGDITESDANKLRELYNEKPSEFISSYNELIEKLQQTGDAAIEAGNKALQGDLRFQSFVKNSKHLASDLGSLAAALNMVSGLFNTTSRSGQIASGSLMIFSGALRAGKVAVEAFQAAAKGESFAMPWLTIAMAAISIVNGLATAFETADERAERLAQEAKKLNDEAKQQKAEYNTLQRSIDKLDELEQKRHDNAEAAEEYQTVVDELAESMPELVRGFDEAGNVVIDLRAAEGALTEARQKTLRATYDAAKAEQEVSAQQLQNAKTAVAKIGREYNSKEQYIYNILGRTNTSDIIQNIVSKIPNSSISQQLLSNNLPLEEMLSSDNLQFLASDLSEKIIPAVESLSNIQNFEDFKRIANESGWLEIPDIQELVNNLEQLPQQLENIGQESNDIVADFITDLENIDFDTEEGQKRFSDFTQAYAQLSEEQKERFNEEITNYEDLVTNIQNIVDNSKIDTGNKRALISSYIKMTQSQQDGWDFLEDNAQAALLLTQTLTNSWTKGNWNTFKDSDEMKSVLEQYQEAYNSLSNSQKQLFEQLGSDAKSFTASDIISALDLSADNDFSEYIRSYYTDGTEELTRINEAFSTLRKNERDSSLSTLQQKITNLDEEVDFSSDAVDFIIAQANLIKEASQKGYQKAAINISNSTQSILDRIYQEDVTALDRNVILDILKEANYNTREGFDETIEQIQNRVNNRELANELILDLQERRDNLLENITSNLQADIGNMLDEAEDETKILSKAMSGMNVKEANELISAAKEWNVDLSFDDSFIQNGDKLVLSEEAFNELQTNYSEYLRKVANDAEDNLQQARDIGIINDSGLVTNYTHRRYDSLGKIKEFLDAQNFDTNVETGYVNEAGEITEVGQQAIQAIFDNFNNQLEEANIAIDTFSTMFFKEQNWNRGDYSSLQKSLEDYGASLEDLASFDGIALKTTDYDLRAAREKLNSVYSSVISDALSKGLDKINPADYQGLIDNQINTDLLLKNFVERYSKLAGKTIEETNDLIIQAIEKDSASTTGAAADAVKDINFLTKDIAYASLDTLNELAAAYGEDVQTLFDINDYNAALGGYRVDMSRLAELGFDKIENASSVVADSVVEFLKSITDAIGKGLNGKLSFAEKDTLISELARYGIELSETDFSRTAEGLNLSTDVAINLYNTLKDIDAISGQILFNQLKDSLTSSDEGLSNISATTATIAKTQKQIAENEKKINDLREEDKGDKADKIDKENEALKQQLNLYKQIAVAQSADSDSFDFMGRNLPDALQGPQKYWDSVGEAYKSMNTASSTGKMEMNDFYNIVNEMSNLAAMSGQSIDFMGYSIDGSLENASQLIQKGFNALSNVDGEGVKIDMSQLAADLNTGAQDMGKGFDTAIKSMAKSQIAMLDGMIQLLETIVTMEQLGDIDVDKNGIIDIGELFDDSLSNYSEAAQPVIDDLIAAANVNTEVKEQYESFAIEGFTFFELLENRNGELERLTDEGRKRLAKLFSAFMQLANSDNYDIENLPASIQQLFKEAGLDNVAGQYLYDEEANLSVLTKPGIGEFTVDWSNFTPERLEELGINRTQKEAQELLENYAHEKDLDTLEYLDVLKLTGQIELQDDGNYKFNGSSQTYSENQIADMISRSIQAGFDPSQITVNEQTGAITVNMKINGFETKVEIDEDGSTTYDFGNGKVYTADSEQDAFTQFYNENRAAQGWVEGQGVVWETEEEFIEQHTKVNVDNKFEVNAEISQTQKDALRNATADEINTVLKTDGVEEVEKHYGIKLTGKITEDDIPEILTNAGIETKDIKINLTVTGEDKEVAEKLLAETTDPVTLTVNLTKGTDATGLFDKVDENGNLTRNVTITFNDGTQLTLDVAGVDTSGDTWTIKGVTSEMPNVDLGEAEIVGITFNDGWTLNGAVTANGVDLGAATISNLSSNGDGSWTLTTSVGGSIVLTADEINGLLNNDLTLAQDATGQLTLTANVSKYGTGFKNGMPVTEATLEVETEVPDLDVTMDAATETVDAWFDGLQGREIKASFSVEPDGTVNSRGLGRNSEVIYNNTSGGATRTDTSVDTSGINDFVEAAKQAGQEVSSVAAAMDTIESTNVEAIQSAQQAIKTDKIDAVRDAVNAIDSTNANAAKLAINNIDPTNAKSAKSAINTIKSNIPVSIDLKVSSTGGVTVASVNGSGAATSKVRLNAPKAKGNVALAKGKGTLMGELGEELVVSGGRYFLAGSNGPEFVDLAADAIVFNHLQTKKLLQSGYANGRGKPITNERRATAFAHGNVEGPALASASQALAALKQIRAMWQSMLDASSRDLGSRAGSGGGGGGGGGGNGNTFVPKNATHEIQRWYNLLRQIEKLERDITYQESLQNKYENDRIVNGTKIYKSYQDELRFLNQEIDRQKELVDLQRSWYDQAAAQLEASDYGKIFTYNENGLMQYRGNSMPGSGEGLDILENLNRRDVYGRAIDNAETAQKQLAYLQSIGFAIDNLKYNDDGTTVAEQRNGKFVKVEKDENGNDVEKDLTNEELSQVYVDMMNNFWDNLDGWRDELDSLYDNVIDTENSIVENQVKQNEIVQKIVDNQIDVENKVLQAIEDMRQAEIDAAQEERDVFADAADKMINDLNDALNKERQMYQNNENQKDIEKLQRQLAILQRSGGSGSQIQNLQQQLNAKQQDQYFNERQQQIDAIKEASDKQIEKMDRQIELMTETLDYQKENGLLWGQVYDILSKPAAEVWQFIANNSKELQAASALQQEQEYINTMDKLEVYDADRKAAEDMAAGVQGSILDGVGAVSQFNAGEAYTAQKSDTDIEALTRKMDELKQAFEFQQGVDSVDLSESGDTDDSSGGSGGSSGTRKSFKDKVAAAQQENLTWWQRSANAISEKANEKIKTAKTVATTANAVTGVVNAIAKVSDVVNKVTNSLTKKTNSVDTTSAKRRISGTVKYATGGLNTQTGWAWLDGTPSKPEYVLNPEQTEILRDSLINRNPATASLNSAAYSSRADMANGSTYSTINNDSGVNIESVQMNLNVPAINNDYDAKRAGEMAMNEMLRIARKTGNRSLSRR